MDQQIVNRIEKDITEMRVSVARMEVQLDNTLNELKNKDKEIDKLKVDMEAIKAWKYTSAGSIGLLIGLLIKLTFDYLTGK